MIYQLRINLALTKRLAPQKIIKKYNHMLRSVAQWSVFRRVGLRIKGALSSIDRLMTFAISADHLAHHGHHQYRHPRQLQHFGRDGPEKAII
jgi:hypothetical protein